MVQRGVAVSVELRDYSVLRYHTSVLLTAAMRHSFTRLRLLEHGCSLQTDEFDGTSSSASPQYLHRMYPM